MKNCLTQKNPKMRDPILVTLLKMQPHYSQSSSENATPSSNTSPLASYCIRKYTSRASNLNTCSNTGRAFRVAFPVQSIISFLKVLIFIGLNSHAPATNGYVTSKEGGDVCVSFELKRLSKHA